MAHKSFSDGSILVDTDSKTVKAIPRTEDGPMVDCMNRVGERYIISQQASKKLFTLWRAFPKDVGHIKLRTAKSPMELYPDIFGD